MTVVAVRRSSRDVRLGRVSPSFQKPMSLTQNCSVLVILAIFSILFNFARFSVFSTGKEKEKCYNNEIPLCIVFCITQ